MTSIVLPLLFPFILIFFYEILFYENCLNFHFLYYPAIKVMQPDLRERFIRFLFILIIIILIIKLYNYFNYI